MNTEKEVEKIIRLTFPNIDDWDKRFVDHTDVIGLQYVQLIEGLIIKEKDKLLFNACCLNYLYKKVFFDVDHNFNDTLNKLKRSTVELVSIFNAQ